MRVLITNDDGIHAEGMWRVCEAFRDTAELLVVLPDRPRSCASHSMMKWEALHLQEATILDGLPVYLTNGTPADCVAFGAMELAGEGVDLVVSGTNHGWNLGIDTSYSGTVMAAAEASLLSLPGLAVSVGGEDQERYETASFFARLVAERMLDSGLPPGTFLNVNVPSIPREEIKGIAVTSLGLSTCRNGFEKRSHPFGGTYYWRGGVKPAETVSEREEANGVVPGTDIDAVLRGFVSVTPLHLDMTDTKSLDALSSWDLTVEAGIGGTTS